MGLFRLPGLICLKKTLKIFTSSTRHQYTLRSGTGCTWYWYPRNILTVFETFIKISFPGLRFVRLICVLKLFLLVFDLCVIHCGTLDNHFGYLHVCSCLNSCLYVYVFVICVFMFAFIFIFAFISLLLFGVWASRRH